MIFSTNLVVLNFWQLIKQCDITRLSFGFWGIVTNPYLISRQSRIQKQFFLLFKMIQKFLCYSLTIFLWRRCEHSMYHNFSNLYFLTQFHRGDFEKSLEIIFEGRPVSQNSYIVLVILLFAQVHLKLLMVFHFLLSHESHYAFP